MRLTKEQYKAITHLDGNILVNSGAGSGKTAVLTNRIINLIVNHNVAPNKILGLTFTKDAAENMRLRLTSNVSQTTAQQVHLSTFHSFARGVLLHYFPNEFKHKSVPKDWWKLQTASDIVGKKTGGNYIGMDLGINVGDFLAFVSYQKANMVRQGDKIILDHKMSFVMKPGRDKLQNAFNKYCELANNANAQDFDDMLLSLYYKLKEDAVFRTQLKNKYQYVLVDEFQDTSKINLEIVKMITENNLFVVGDFRQSIYGFNNSEIDNILTFKNQFSNTTLIELTHNFRSEKPIVQFANSIIASSPIAKYKEFSEQKYIKDNNGNVRVSCVQNEHVQISEIIEKIEKIKNENPELSYSDFCILARTNSQQAIPESALSDADIPAKLSGTGSFFDRKEIQDLLAYAKHGLDSTDDMSFRQIVNVPNRYIGKAAIHQLDEYSSQNNISLREAIFACPTLQYKDKLLDLHNFFTDMQSSLEDNAFKFFTKLINTIRYRDHLKQRSKTHSELIAREEVLNKFLEMSKKYPTVISMIASIEKIKTNSKNIHDAVNVMTVHASKGMEFEYVFVIGVNEKSFPHEMNTDIEEERRLLYVAASRAISHLDIFVPIFDNGEQVPPSPFLIDVLNNRFLDAKRKVLTGAKVVGFNL
ncbi:ATP-dependent helicase [Aerococcaceae bacterium zg-B36]|uniref:ATP-dependent helicase n=1 Tax=Aerococcaceae bacterium zg-252 TaxID=2796928 RepID=UPI001BD85220|nr:ATP-dependent helicase [Aerococcaceae bacterium zg-B36]